MTGGPAAERPGRQRRGSRDQDLRDGASRQSACHGRSPKSGRVYQASASGFNGRADWSNELKNILYLHGFASSPQGRKVTALRELLAPRGLRVVAPDLNIPSFERLDFKAMTKLSFWEVKRHLPAVVVGSSLGAMVALAVSRIALRAPLVLIAPALGFGSRWLEKLPPGDPVRFFHHGAGQEMAVHRRFFEEMSRVDADRDPPEVAVVLMMGRRDESVPFESVAEVWRRWEASGRLSPGSRFVEISDGDHGLLAHVDRIADEVLALSEAPRS
ncbi:MAG: YqiA/YcfP family alpha/beta fold hydrolase [Thermoanaerobaculia bacterium]